MIGCGLDKLLAERRLPELYPRNPEGRIGLYGLLRPHFRVAVHGDICFEKMRHAIGRSSRTYCDRCGWKGPRT